MPQMNFNPRQAWPHQNFKGKKKKKETEKNDPNVGPRVPLHHPSLPPMTPITRWLHSPAIVTFNQSFLPSLISFFLFIFFFFLHFLQTLQKLPFTQSPSSQFFPFNINQHLAEPRILSLSRTIREKKKNLFGLSFQLLLL